MNDDHELSPEARALLTQAAGGDDPSPKDRARVRRALMATIAGGAGLAASSAASSAAASATAAGTVATGASISLGVKIAAVVLVVGAVSGTVAVAPWEPGTPAIAAHEATARPTGGEERSSARHAPVITPPAPVVAASPEPVEAAPVVEEGAAPPPTIAVSTPRATPRGAIVARSPRAPSAIEPPPVVLAEPAPAPSPSTLAEEMRILRSAQNALRAGDPDSALGRLAEHARRFPTGAMVEEREAARIVALCRAGRREEARTAAVQFLRERPTSPLAARVRASCD